jgi:hypothetical protein
MHFLRRSAPLLVVLSVEMVAVAAVHRLGARAPFNLPIDDLQPWLRAAPEDALAAALRVVALVYGWWLLVATAAYSCARAAAIPAAVRACEWATPRTIRRTVDRALVASMVIGAVASSFGAHPVGAAQGPPPQVSVDVRSGKGLESLPSAPAPPPVTTVVAVERVADPPIAQLADPSNDSLGATVVVAPGDNLWDLSASALAAGTGRERVAIGDDEIARYWRTVCDVNHDTLRSGNVDLIYPGEVVALPPIT